GGALSVHVSSGSQLLLSGNDAAVGSLFMLAEPEDKIPTIVDTGTTRLRVNEKILASSYNDQFHPIIKGRLDFAGSGTIEVDPSANQELEISASIEGAGFSKAGPGTLLLSGITSVAGDLRILEGTLHLVSSSWLHLDGLTAGVHLGNGSI